MTIRRSPAEYYLRYLITNPRSRSTEALQKRFESAQLDYLGDEYVERLRSEMSPPKTFRPWVRGHEPSRRFLVKHRIFDLYHRPRAVEQAFRLLGDPRAPLR